MAFNYNISANSMSCVREDSIIVGDSTSSSQFHIDQLIQDLATKHGLPIINGINNGHSGQDTEHWNTTHYATDLSMLILTY